MTDTTQPPAETLELIAELAPLVAKASHPNGWEWMFPLRVVPVDGKPTIVSHKGGNLFRGYIATWDEADLLVSLANAAPRILAALTRRAGGDAGTIDRCIEKLEQTARWSINDGRKWFNHPAANEAFEYAIAALRTVEPCAGGDAREWPDIGEDPMKGTPYEDRMAVSTAALRKAYTVQQPIVPDQTALVWRWHIAALLEAEIRLRSILARDDYAGDPDGDEPVDAGGDAIPAGALPQHIGRVHLGERRSDGERLCSHGHEVPAGHPLYWPEQISQYDDSDPLCLAHAIEQAESDNADWDATPKPPAGGDAGAEAADILDHYAQFIRDEVKADDLERHPYLPHIEQVAADLRTALALPAPVVEGDARERFKVALVDAARARGGAGAVFIANGHTNIWLDAAYDAFAALSEGCSHG